MKILVDYQNVSGQYTGVPRATQDDVISLILGGHELTLWISKDESFKIELAMENYDSTKLEIAGRSFQILSNRSRNRSAWIKQFLPIGRSKEFEYILATHFPAIGSRSTKRIIRMHDPFKSSASLLPSFRTLSHGVKNEIARTIRNLAYVQVAQNSITVASSYFMANQIRENYDKFDITVEVINCAVGFQNEILVQDPNKDNFLIVGGMRQRKRPDIGINAWAATFSSHKRDLIVVGSVPRERLSRFATELLLRGNLKMLDRVSSQELAILQEDALATIFVSTGEGFGRPIAESLLRGTPVIVNNLEVFREFDCDYVHYFDLSQEKELESLIVSLASPLDSESELKCREFGKRYSYERISLKWAELFNRY